MVVNQRLLGLLDNFFDRMQLLGDIDTGAADLDHRDHLLRCPSARLRRLTISGWEA
jgi:hypothetical protein